MEGGLREEAQVEAGHLPAKGRGLDSIPPSQASEGVDPASTLVLDFETPEMQDQRFMLFKLLNLWYLVTIALAKTNTARLVDLVPICPYLS